MHFHVVSAFDLAAVGKTSQSAHSNEVPTGMVGSVPHNYHTPSSVRALVAASNQYSYDVHTCGDRCG